MTLAAELTSRFSTLLQSADERPIYTRGLLLRSGEKFSLPNAILLIQASNYTPGYVWNVIFNRWAAGFAQVSDKL